MKKIPRNIKKDCLVKRAKSLHGSRRKIEDSIIRETKANNFIIPRKLRCQVVRVSHKSQGWGEIIVYDRMRPQYHKSQC